MLRRLLLLLRDESGQLRRPLGTVIVAAAIVTTAGGIIIREVVEDPPPAGTAHYWIDTSGGTCARNSTPAAYSDATACSSLDVAYRDAEAACGDTTLIKGGTYDWEMVIEDSDMSACGSNRVFEEASGETAIWDIKGPGTAEWQDRTSIWFGTDAAWQTNGADRITIRGIQVDGMVMMYSDADNIVLDDIEGGSFYIEGGTNITVTDGDWGPCPSTMNVSGFPGKCGRNFILDHASSPTHTANVLIENNTFHDFEITLDGDHWEAFFTQGGGTNVVFRDNRFWNNDTYHINTGNRDGVDYVDWVIENNWFGNTCCFGGFRSPLSPVGSTRNSAINVNTTEEVLVRFNSFADLQDVVSEGAVTTAGLTVVGNILGDLNVCLTGATYNFNIWTDTGSVCGSNGTQGVSPMYANNADDENGDYHLGSGTKTADNYVTSGTAPLDLGLDYDAETRPNAADGGVNRDAGSDERDSP